MHEGHIAQLSPFILCNVDDDTINALCSKQVTLEGLGMHVTAGHQGHELNTFNALHAPYESLMRELNLGSTLNPNQSFPSPVDRLLLLAAVCLSLWSRKLASTTSGCRCYSLARLHLA